MIIKLTLILSNDKYVHIRDDADKQMLEQILTKQYQEAFSKLVSLGDNPSEKAIVKECKLIKEV